MNERATVVLIMVAASLGLLAIFVFTGNEPESSGAVSHPAEPVRQTERPSAPGTLALPPDPPMQSAAGNRNVLTGSALRADDDSSGLNDGLDAENGRERRTATDTSARTEGDNADTATNSLSQRVRDVIAEVQARQLDGQWEEALNEMNALYENFEDLNPFEQVTLLNFYTNTLLQLEMWQESISAFSQMLTIPELRPDINVRALIALGQLHNQLGETAAAIAYYESALLATRSMDNMEGQIQRVERLLSEAIEATAN